jgi:uncharacterized repeat protein (TIGR02543 family)
MSSTLRNSSVLFGIIFLLPMGSLQAADATTWIVGSDSVWKSGSGSGGGPVDLSTYRFYGSMSILDSLEALHADGTMAYRTLHGWDGYEGQSICPDTTLTIPTRPAPPVKGADYHLDFRSEKINVFATTHSSDSLQLMQVGGTPVWTSVDSGGSWTFRDAGWDPGWVERRFRVRFAATNDAINIEKGAFASSYSTGVIPARPAEPVGFCLRNSIYGADTTFVSHPDSASYYELRADSVASWTSPYKSCPATDTCWSIHPARLDSGIYHLRYAATDSLPASLSAIISGRLTIVKSIIFPSYVYGTKVDESKRKNIEILNYSTGTIPIILQLQKGTGSPFKLTLPNGDTTRVRGRENSECFAFNSTNSIIPKDELSGGMYADSLVITYSDGAVQYVDVVVEVFRADWDMSNIYGSIVYATENMLTLQVGGAPVGAKLSYYFGSTYVSQSSDTVSKGGFTSYPFPGLTPATAYPIGVKPLGDVNYMEPEQPTMLVIGYTAHATPVFDQTVKVNYMLEQLDFIPNAHGSDYTVAAIAGTDTVAVPAPYPLTSYLDSLTVDEFRLQLVHNAGINPPFPASTPGRSSPIKGRMPAPALDSITIGSANGSNTDGKIHLRGDFQYRVHTVIGGSGGQSWTSAKDSVTTNIGSGWYDIRRPPTNATFASRYISVKVGGQCVVTFNGNGGHFFSSSNGSYSATNQTTVTEGVPMVSVPNNIANPTRVGHKFDGWYTTLNSTLGTKWNFLSDTVKQDTTLYAAWAVDKVSLTIGAVKDMQTITYGKDDSICFTPYAATPLPAGCALSGSLTLNGAAKSSSGHYRAGRYGFNSSMIVVFDSIGNDTVTQYFNISIEADSVAVAPRPVTAKPYPQSKAYGDSDPELTWRLVSGSFVSGDTLTGSLKHGGVNVGRYAIEEDAALSNPNYSVTYQKDSITIVAAPLIITPSSGQSKVYGENDQPFAFTVSGWRRDDKADSAGIITGALSRVEGEDAGAYPITQGSISVNGSNYAIQFVENVMLEIVKDTPVDGDTSCCSKVVDVEVIGAAADTGNAGRFVVSYPEAGIVTVAITPHDSGAKVVYNGEEVASFPIDVSRAGTQQVIYTVISPDGSWRDDTIWVEQRLKFDQYAYAKWDNTLMVNNMLLRREGYRLLGCRWYEGSVLVGTGASFSKGNSVTDVLLSGVEYRFELETGDGLVRSTPQVFEETFAGGFRVYPTLIASGEILYVDANTSDSGEEKSEVSVLIYSITGALVAQQPIVNRHAQVRLSVPPGTYIVKIKNWQVKVVVN